MSEYSPRAKELALKLRTKAQDNISKAEANRKSSKILRDGRTSAASKTAAASALFGKEKRRSLKRWLQWRITWFRVSVFREKNLPDGVLNGGSVVTFWEEDGEYIQMVQPSVGSLVADFLLAEPNHPHAVIIRAELDRIAEGYTQRVKEGKVS